MRNVYTEDQLSRMPEEEASRKRYFMQGVPDAERMVSPERLAELCQDPKFREAVDLMERVEGHTKGVKKMAYYALKHNREADMQADEQRRAIEIAMSRKG